jgi:transposase
VEKILDTLQGLQPGEAFFFIDEVGPYQVKKYGGKSLMAKDQIVKIPEFQKSKGKVIFAAALEALSNQMSWVFTADKSSQSFITLIEKLAREYAFISKMYLTWDALSVHSSKAVMEWIATHNQSGNDPAMEVVPLPANSQFLNVIEAVFGGMKRAVIVNSDYSSAQDMQAAIARHFEERNQFYRDNPKRAGNKIWDKQAFDLEKLAAGLFKKM